MPDPRRPAIDLTALALAAVVAAAVVALPAGAAAGDRPEMIFLALLAVPALAAAASLSPAPAIELGGGAALSALVGWAIAAPATRGALLVAVLLAVLAIAVARRLRQEMLTAGQLWLLALALQFLTRGSLFVEPGAASGERALMIFGIEPLTAGLASSVLAAVWGAWGLLAAALVATSQQGLHTANCAALAGLAALAWLGRAHWVPRRRVPAALGFAAGVLLAVTTLVASYPWLQPRPLAAALRLPAEAARAAGGRELLEGKVVLLDAAQPEWLKEVSGPAVTELVVVSNLANAATLPGGAEAIELELESETGERHRLVLLAGRDTGEWAARRPDVAALSPAAPRGWLSLAADGFFAQRYRSVHRLERPWRLRRLTLRRGAALPGPAQAAIFALEVR